MRRTLGDFLMESNAIEGIKRMVTGQEHKEAERFLALERVELSDLVKFVNVFERGARLRTRDGDNVTVGRHLPPFGGPAVGYALMTLLMDANGSNHTAYEIHVRYELLHPFMDCNGRSGRMLWLWMVNKKLGRLPDLSFLHSFYYSALDNARLN